MDVDRTRAAEAPAAPVVPHTRPRRGLLDFARPRPQSPPPVMPAPRAPEATSAWLHVVSGQGVEAIARGAFELAARFLARGDRVLLVDAGPRLHLHERFERESRWGVVECLTGRLPVLGLVQDTGRLGLYLLAYGTPARRTHWPQLGRLLDEARPHFARAVVAIETDAPPVIGEALGGWHLEGWWAGEEVGARRRDRLVGRLGIPLHGLDAAALPRATVESMNARLWSLAAERASEPANDAVAAAPAPPAPPAARATEPVVIACDPTVRERLRFLLWMRRLQAAPVAVPEDVEVVAR